MDTVVRLSGSRSCPALRYRDVNFAASWLCTAFGFERHSTIEDDDKRTNYAELSFGNTIIMLGAIGGFEVDNLMKQPDEICGAETQCSYFIVDDLDAHYAQARDAGAKIVLEIKTHLNGARGYACADPEGHLWNFGTYDPHRRVNEVKEATGTTGPSPLDTSPLLRLGLPTESRSSPNFLRRVAVGVGISAIGLILASVSVAAEGARSGRRSDIPSGRKPDQCPRYAPAAHFRAHGQANCRAQVRCNARGSRQGANAESGS